VLSKPKSARRGLKRTVAPPLALLLAVTAGCTGSLIRFGGPVGRKHDPSLFPEASRPPPQWSGHYKAERFRHWLGLRWVEAHPDAPTTIEELSKFPTRSLLPEYGRYLNTPEAMTDGKMGLTLQEAWFMHQILQRREIGMLMNEHMPAQPTPRVTRRRDAPPAQILNSANELLSRGCQVAAAVFDGQTGHFIRLVRYDPEAQTVLYIDSWPGRSLLCEENNAAGVKAVATKNEHIWSITVAEFEKIIYAAFLYMPDNCALQNMRVFVEQSALDELAAGL
jgi:hypothetical protein